jgi:hypothetical protein
MDGLVEELLRLERAKHKALVTIDAPTYDASVREQMRVLGETKGSMQSVADIEPLLVLSRLISLNARLLQNLLLTAPFFALGLNGYTAAGRLSLPSESGRVMVEA